jgi:hypothetical protein
MRRSNPLRLSSPSPGAAFPYDWGADEGARQYAEESCAPSCREAEANTPNPVEQVMVTVISASTIRANNAERSSQHRTQDSAGPRSLDAKRAVPLPQRAGSQSPILSPRKLRRDSEGMPGTQ